MHTLRDILQTDVAAFFFSFYGMDWGNIAPKGSFVITGQYSNSAGKSNFF